MSLKPPPPDAAELERMLGQAASLWTQLQETIRTAYAPVTERWVYGGSKYGWSCRLERDKKGILYMTPEAGHFRVGMAVSDATRQRVLDSDVPAPIREALETATKAIEGWPIRMPVRTAADAAVAETLAAIKQSS